MKQLTQWMAIIATGLGVAGLVGCASVSQPQKPQKTTAKTNPHIPVESFGKMPDGTNIEIYTLRNSKGMEARIMTYGGIVVSLKVPDKNGNLGDVVLGFDNLDDYVNDNYVANCPYFGALIGRYGNRIAKGKFTLDGKTCSLPQNNGENTLHGGPKGFDKVVWNAQPIQSSAGQALKLTYLSKDGEEGFPGNLSVTAIYTVTEDNALRLDFTATTDKPTVCNLTHHSYFNLRGSGEILNHEVYINADTFTPVDSNLIPTGELRPVQGTPFDFRVPTRIGARINDTNDEQIKFGNGYDHNWVINKNLNELSLMARVDEPESGRIMEVFSTEPATQFYTGNYLDGSLTGKGGWIYQRREGFCFEPQHYPDSPNHPSFPSTELDPGETYKNTIIYKFSVH